MCGLTKTHEKIVIIIIMKRKRSPFGTDFIKSKATLRRDNMMIIITV